GSPDAAPRRDVLRVQSRAGQICGLGSGPLHRRSASSHRCRERTGSRAHPRGDGARRYRLMAKKADPEKKVVADNRKARFSYAIDGTIEAGIMLMGSEVKALRTGKATIAESYAHAQTAGAQDRSAQAFCRRAARGHDADTP